MFLLFLPSIILLKLVKSLTVVLTKDARLLCHPVSSFEPHKKVQYSSFEHESFPVLDVSDAVVFALDIQISKLSPSVLL